MGWVIWFGFCVICAVLSAIYAPAWTAACWGFNAGIALAIVGEK